MRITLVYPETPDGQPDGVRDHGEHLAAALRAIGHETAVDTRCNQGSDVNLIQYSPFAWGRFGLSASRVADVLRARRTTTVGVIVHEPFVAGRSPKELVLGGMQRLQLFVLGRAASVLFLSTMSWAPYVGWIRRRMVGLPVGSTLPKADQPSSGDRPLTVAAFDSPHPGRSRTLLETVLRQLPSDATVLLLGAEARPLLGLAATVERPGALRAADLALRLARADLFLAPFVDGVSTRRTTVMAALQHAVPVLGTRGQLTDAAFDRADGRALLLVDVDEPAAFAVAAAALLADPGRRARLGREGQALYAREFDWSVTAAVLVRALKAR